MERGENNVAEGKGTHKQLEDRCLKVSAQFFGDELLAYLGSSGEIVGVAPTEQVRLEVRKMEEDFNFVLKDGTWKHLEFESDSITDADLRRFREYEASIGSRYQVPVSTIVLCSSKVRCLKKELCNGPNVYRVEIIRTKDQNADTLMDALEEETKLGSLDRKALFPVILSPLMSGNRPMEERIQRALKLLRSDQAALGKADLKQMEAVLYTLAVKFLNKEELRKIKEMMHMTILGQMIWEDGREDGREEGREEGIRALIEVYLSYGESEAAICANLCRKFQLDEEQAWSYIRKYANLSCV